MQTRKIPPRIFHLNQTDYIVLAWDAGWYEVAFYRPYKPGEDGVRAEDAPKIHKRFAIRRKSLLDGLRVILTEGDAEHDADMTEIYIRKTNLQALPGDPGEMHRVPTEETTAENPAAS